jgi:two-component system chemotaxis response regulator CheB
MRAKTKLLIVDDSRIFRSAIEESLKGADDVEVIGSVWNGVKAMEFIGSNRPDVVTLDVEMPDMDGLETLKAIQKVNASDRTMKPIGVIMVSSHTKKGADTTIKALEMGAFDFISKAEGKDLKESMELLRSQLLVKIRHFAAKRISLYIAEPPTRDVQLPPQVPSKKPVSSRIKVIVIGVSTGGPRAMAEMLPSLCELVDLPICVVQHMPATFTESLAKSLNAACLHTVMEGKDNEVIQDKHVYIAPGGKHMLFKKSDQTVSIVVNDLPPEKGCKPSVDILFRSAATVYGKDVIGIILTGMGVDGTKGAAALKRAGASIIVQDEKTSVVWGMPGSVEASGNVDMVLPLNRIPQAVVARMVKLRPE